MPAFVYIIKDDGGRLYVGSTVDIKKRFAAHLGGHTQTTRNMKNIRLAVRQIYPTLQDARRVEKRLKRLKRRDYLEKIIQDGYIKIR